MIVKIDVDGVIRDIITTMCRIYEEEFGARIEVDEVVDYDINTNFPLVMERTGMKPTEYFFVKNAHRVFHSEVSPFRGACDAIRKLRENGYEVVIVTWQFNFDNIMHTLKFLHDYGVEYDDICFTKNKWMICGDYIIDDNPGFIDDDREQSYKVIVDTPYNKHVNGVARVDSLEEAVEFILAREEDKKKPQGQCRSI